MTRFSGKVGFGQAVETPPNSGKWPVVVTERTYRGDVVSATRRAVPGEQANDGISMDVTISIVSDPYAIEHLRMIKYVELDGSRWEVTSVQPRRPRLVLHLGGVYRGPTP